MSVHLCVRSAYSLLESTMNVANIVQTAKERGFSAVALTDKNVMHGTMEFYALCKKAGIKPILGVEVSVLFQDEKAAFIMLAQDNTGYQNCLKASTILNTETNCLSFDIFKELSKHCMILAEGEGGVFEKNLINDNEVALIEQMTELKDSIENLFVGLSYHETSFWRIKNNYLKQLAKSCDIQTVALPKVYYRDEHDEELLKVLKGIKSGMTLQDPSLTSQPNRFFLSVEQMENIYDYEDLAVTDRIAEMCEVELETGKTELPQFDCPEGVTSAQYLTQLCLAGAKKRNCISKPYMDRLKYELDVIVKMHFEDYFLIVWDFIRYSKKNGIYVGPGRGSAAGVLVAYVLGITHIDPLKYGLMFERFLNPERVSMPDIDTDFPDNRRDEVIRYVKDKYGKDHVAHISTFGTLAAKQAIRDVGRVMNIPLREIDTICKLVPKQLKITLKQAYEQSSPFKKYIDADIRYTRLFKTACRIEGLPRHVSTHAAGIVFSKRPLDEVVPCIALEEGTVSTQYTAEYLESLGLIKMDFLGLRNLTIIDEVVRKVQDRTELDIMKIPFDDESTFKIIQNVDTIGIFQLESDGMMNLIKKIRPNCFDDIVAVIALFRPGPMENIPRYLTNRQDPSKIKYLHPDLEPILKSTYGVMIYQEQIMQISQKMAGFSLAKADTLRRAISKKKLKELEALESEFIQGCIQNHYGEKLAHEIYDLILKFANFGFNKSHSVAYGVVAYQMAYLKANYPLEFFCALLNSVSQSESKCYQYIEECRRLKVDIRKPSVNFSTMNFEIEKDAIRMSLLCVKSLGSVACTQILKERAERGLFKDYYDFVARILTRKINKKMIETLIDAGALDEFKMNRKSMLLSLDDAISYGDLVRIDIEGQSRIDLGLVSTPVPIIANESILERCEREKTALGFYLTMHPITQMKQDLHLQVQPLAFSGQKNGSIQGFAIIQKVKQHRTKNGDLMAFVNIMDESGNMDLVVMPNLYQKYQEYLQKGKFIIFEGEMNQVKGSCLVKKIKFSNM